jgi:hypothetical protein
LKHPDVADHREPGPGQGLLLDTTKLGYVAIRESLSMRLGYSGAVAGSPVGAAAGRVW